MRKPDVDDRSIEQREKDAQVAAEPRLAPPDLPARPPMASMESHLRGDHRRPMAVVGIVENGLVRPLDPAVKLPEHARVIIVGTGQP